MAPLAIGRRITTIEGLPADDPVMACFDRHHAFQCGFCIPGMVLTARDMVDSGRAGRPRGDPGRARRQSVPLRLLRQDHRRDRGGGPMKYVTYRSAGGDRVGYLDGDDVVDAGFDGDMVAFIEAGAPARHTMPPVPEARLLAPLRPRTLRDFLAFEGHLKNAFAGLGKEIPDEWYTVPAYYKGLPDTVIGPGGGDPVAVLHRQARPRTRAGRRDRRRRQGHHRGRRAGARVRLHDLERHVGPRRPGRELPVGMGPSKAKDWDGSNVLGPCIVTADEIDSPTSSSRSGSTARGGAATHRQHAPHLRAT